MVPVPFHQQLMGSCMLRISKEHNAATRFFFFAFFSSSIRGRSVQVQPTNVIVLLYRVTHCVSSCRLHNLDLPIIIKQQLRRIPTLSCGPRTTKLAIMILIGDSCHKNRQKFKLKLQKVFDFERMYLRPKNAKPSIFLLRFHLDLNKPFFSAQTDPCSSATRPYISHTKN